MSLRGRTKAMIIDEMNDRIWNQLIEYRKSVKGMRVYSAPFHTDFKVPKTTATFSIFSCVPWISIILLSLYIACIHWNTVPNHNENDSIDQQNVISDLNRTDLEDQTNQNAVVREDLQRKLNQTQKNLKEAIDELQTYQQGVMQESELLLQLRNKDEDIERLKSEVEQQKVLEMQRNEKAEALETQNQNLEVQLEEQHQQHLISLKIFAVCFVAIIVLFSAGSYFYWSNVSSETAKLEQENVAEIELEPVDLKQEHVQSKKNSGTDEKKSEAAGKQHDAVRSSLRAVKSEVTKLVEKGDAAKQERDTAQSSLDAVKSEVTKLVGEWDTAEKKRGTAQSSLDAVKSEATKLVGQLKEARNQRNIKRKSLNAVNAKDRELVGWLEEAKKRRDEKQELLDSTNIHADRLEGQREDAEKRRDGERKLLEAANSQADELVGQRQNLERALEKLSAERAAVKLERHGLKADLETLKAKQATEGSNDCTKRKGQDENKVSVNVTSKHVSMQQEPVTSTIVKLELVALRQEDVERITVDQRPVCEMEDHGDQISIETESRTSGLALNDAAEVQRLDPKSRLDYDSNSEVNSSQEHHVEKHQKETEGDHENLNLKRNHNAQQNIHETVTQQITIVGVEQHLIERNNVVEAAVQGPIADDVAMTVKVEQVQEIAQSMEEKECSETIDQKQKNEVEEMWRICREDCEESFVDGNQAENVDAWDHDEKQSTMKENVGQQRNDKEQLPNNVDVFESNLNFNELGDIFKEGGRGIQDVMKENWPALHQLIEKQPLKAVNVLKAEGFSKMSAEPLVFAVDRNVWRRSEGSNAWVTFAKHVTEWLEKLYNASPVLEDARRKVKDVIIKNFLEKTPRGPLAAKQWAASPNPILIDEYGHSEDGDDLFIWAALGTITPMIRNLGLKIFRCSLMPFANQPMIFTCIRFSKKMVQKWNTLAEKENLEDFTIIPRGSMNCNAN